tara:strand:- start:277 stop:555 length:279 start_codon:yes stop_codon:yes gene_type:complete
MPKSRSVHKSESLAGFRKAVHEVLNRNAVSRTPLIKERNKRLSLKLKTKTPETPVKSEKSKKRKRRKSQKAVKAQKGGIVRAGSHQKFPSCK